MAKKNLPNIPIYIGDWERDCNAIIEPNSDLVKLRELHNKCFIRGHWKTENTYSNSFAICPEKPGVYAIEAFCLNLDTGKYAQSEILYIGKAKNLKKRKGGHEVLRVVRALMDGYAIRFLWFEHDNPSELETFLINVYSPKINSRYNG